MGVWVLGGYGHSCSQSCLEAGSTGGIDRVCTEQGLADHNDELDSLEEFQNKAGITCEDYHPNWGAQTDVPNYIPASKACYGSKPNRARSTFDCDREIAGRQRMCYCQKASACSVKDGSGPSSAYPCNCSPSGTNICTKGQRCTASGGGESSCSEAPGWRLGSGGSSCDQTCSTLKLRCSADTAYDHNSEVDEQSRFESVLAALPKLSGASDYTPSCENYYTTWGEASDVPNVIATNSSNKEQKKYDCYGSKNARSRSTFDCASSVPARQRLCYCD
jgi:hypothetical protein